MGRVREEKRRNKIKIDQKRESLRRKKIQVREKVGKSRNTVFFQWFVAPEGRKVGSLKRQVRSQLARWEMEKCTPLFGAKHISKSKCTKHTMLGPLLEVEMSKKCTLLWREARLQVKKLKAPQLRSTFGSWDVEKVHALIAQKLSRPVGPPETYSEKGSAAILKAPQQCCKCSLNEPGAFYRNIFLMWKKQKNITLLRVIPTMTIIHFVTGKPFGILSDIPSGILSGISSGILSGISSGILAGISSAICSGISSGTLSGISSGISSDILSGILSGKSSGKHSGTLSGIPTGILSDILSGIPSGILSGISSGISSGILSGISSGILSDILSGILSGISSDILEVAVEVRQCPLRSGSRGWGPAVPTAIWTSRLRSGSAHCDLEVAVEVRQCPLGSGACGGGPAVPTGIWSSRWRSGCAHWGLELAVEVRLCPLGSGLRGGGGGWGGGGGNGGGGGGGEQLW